MKRPGTFLVMSAAEHTASWHPAMSDPSSCTVTEAPTVGTGWLDSEGHRGMDDTAPGARQGTVGARRDGAGLLKCGSAAGQNFIASTAFIERITLAGSLSE